MCVCVLWQSFFFFYRLTNLSGNNDVTHPWGLIRVLIVQTHYTLHRHTLKITHVHTTYKVREVENSYHGAQTFPLWHTCIRTHTDTQKGVVLLRRWGVPHPFNVDGPFCYPAWVITGKIPLDKRPAPATVLNKEDRVRCTGTKSNTFA